MPKITVELDAYVLPEDHRIYKLFPGKTYRFFDTVRDVNTVFLDVRGLDAFDADPRRWRDADILKAISEDRWSRELDRVSRGLKPLSRPGITRTDKRTLTFLKGLLTTAKKGDLIVIPPSGYRREVLIGELLDEPSRTKNVIIKTDDGQANVYVGRRVQWRPGPEKRFLSQDLIDRLHTPAAFFQLPMSLHEEVYRYAFENFAYRGAFVATFHTSKDKFTSEDGAVVSTWFHGLDVLRNAIRDGKQIEIEGESFYALGLLPLADAKSGELSININSPGSFMMRSKDVFALALMVMLLLGQANPDAVMSQGVSVQMHTVGSATDSCRLEVEDSVKAYVDTLSHWRLEEACKLAKRAHEHAKLSTAARLKAAGGKRT
jgi:hypothetical protein